jgi:hypothetical protein
MPDRYREGGAHHGCADQVESEDAVKMGFGIPATRPTLTQHNTVLSKRPGGHVGSDESLFGPSFGCETYRMNPVKHQPTSASHTEQGWKLWIWSSFTVSFSRYPVSAFTERRPRLISLPPRRALVVNQGRHVF